LVEIDGRAPAAKPVRRGGWESCLHRKLYVIRYLVSSNRHRSRRHGNSHAPVLHLDRSRSDKRNDVALALRDSLASIRTDHGQGRVIRRVDVILFEQRHQCQDRHARHHKSNGQGDHQFQQRESPILPQFHKVRLA
jgi:hypothetical protein